MAEQALAAANITSNKNPVPFDNPTPSRLGRPQARHGGCHHARALTSRGNDNMLGGLIADLIDATGRPATLDDISASRQRPKVEKLTEDIPGVRP